MKLNSEKNIDLLQDLSKIILKNGVINFIILLVLIHGLQPNLFIVDNTTNALLIILLIYSYKDRIKMIKGHGFEVQLRDRAQGTINHPLPPQVEKMESSHSFSDTEKRILSTLYKYQDVYFAKDLSKRWGFKINSRAGDAYYQYLGALTSLLKKGLVSVSAENDMCFLTNEGIEYIRKNSHIVDLDNLYTF